MKTQFSIGQRHLETIKRHLQNKDYAQIAKEYNLKLGGYIEDIEELNKQSQRFVDSQFTLKEGSSFLKDQRVIMMNPSEIEESLTNFVNDALSFSKA